MPGIRHSLQIWGSRSSAKIPPVEVVGKWATTALGTAFRIGEVAVSTGDYVLADRDGIVVIPAAIAAEVVQETEEILRTESLVRIR
ncbi:MAG: hypothetical protein WA628_12585 [Terriglobales bacterium]